MSKLTDREKKIGRPLTEAEKGDTAAAQSRGAAGIRQREKRASLLQAGNKRLSVEQASTLAREDIRLGKERGQEELEQPIPIKKTGIVPGTDTAAPKKISDKLINEKEEGEFVPRDTSIFGGLGKPDIFTDVKGVVGEAVPFGPAGPVQAGTGFLKIAESTGRISKIQRIAAQEKSIQKIMKSFKIGRKGAEKISKEYARMKKPAVIRQLTDISNNKLMKKGVKIGGLILVADAMMALWYSVDNIISGHSLLLRDTVGDVQFNGLPVEEAQRTFSEAQEDIDAAKEFVTTSTIVNPLLWWPLGKFYRRGIEAQQFQIDSQRNRLDLLSQPQ